MPTTASASQNATRKIRPPAATGCAPIQVTRLSNHALGLGGLCLPERRITMTSLAGKTLFIPGASRSIGRAIALRAAADGANVAIAAKSDVEIGRAPV